MRNNVFETDHEDYRKSMRTFIEREVTPHYGRWEEQKSFDRSLFVAGIEAGAYGLEIPERFGGPGVSDYRYRLVLSEEIARARATSVGISFTCQDDLVLYYLLDLGTDEQLARWLPPLASGRHIGSLAMTEPGAGSDLRSIRTTAVRDGSSWVLNGQKTFITHAPTSNLVIVAARTDPDAGSRGFSLFVVEGNPEGLVRGPKFDKVGLRAQDTGELFFDEVRVDNSNLLGTAGRGLQQMMSHLPRERLGTTLCAVTDARAVYELTVQHVFGREAFGKTLGDLQATRFSLAEMDTELDIAELYLDNQVLEYNAGRLSATEAAKGKWWATELQKRVIDKCVQLHGGYGFMLEYAVGRAYIDSRIQPIYAGANEVMKDLIGRDIAANVQTR